MDAIAAQLLPYLPPDLQALYYHPPSLTSPGSFVPVIRILFPYAKWVIVLAAVWIVWSFVAGIFGYFSRFLRFATRIGPIIGLVAWLMANSGQGSMEELVGLVKSWVGLDQNAARGGMSPGIASIASLFGSGNANTKTRSGRKKPAGGWAGGAGSDPISSRTRSGKKKEDEGPGAAEFISSFLNSAASKGQNADGNGNDLGGMVQDYVKDSLAKAAGLDWLFGSGATEHGKKEDKKKGWKTR